MTADGKRIAKEKLGVAPPYLGVGQDRAKRGGGGEDI